MIRSTLSAPALSPLSLAIFVACDDLATPESRLEAAGGALEEAREDAVSARQSALRIARSSPGVAVVRDRLAVESEEAG